jgi:hypothetical protein
VPGLPRSDQARERSFEHGLKVGLVGDLAVDIADQATEPETSSLIGVMSQAALGRLCQDCCIISDFRRDGTVEAKRDRGRGEFYLRKSRQLHALDPLHFRERGALCQAV